MTGGEDREADWPFDQGPNVAALTVRAVLEGAPILLVSHAADDDSWQFLDGREPDVAEGRVVSMRSILARDPGLRAIADLEPGWLARRPSADGPWTREPNPHAVEDEEPRGGSIGSRLRRLIGGR